MQVRSIDLLSSDVSLPDAKAEFLGIGEVHCVDLAMAIRAAVVVMAIVAILAVEAVMAIVTVLAIETVMASSQAFRTRTGYQIQGTRSRVAWSSSH